MTPFKKLLPVVRRDPRYAYEAYVFVFQAIDHTLKMLGRELPNETTDAGDPRYHLSGRETHGHSMIVDPWGVVLDRLPRGSGVVIAGVNPGYQANLRKSLPALKHKTIHRV